MNQMSINPRAMSLKIILIHWFRAGDLLGTKIERPALRIHSFSDNQEVISHSSKNFSPADFTPGLFASSSVCRNHSG